MTQLKFVSFYHNNVPTSLNNSMFDTQRNLMTEAPIFMKLRIFLRQRNIYINTYDISTKRPPYKNIHFDIPYPFPSNFSIWKTIVTQRTQNILICTEPPTVNPFNYMKIFHTYFIKVYTWNDTLIDNKKYFKYRLPKASSGIYTRAKQYKEKKFLILINTNKSAFYPFKLLSSFGKELYSERIKSIEFFQARIPNKFYLYGRGWNKPRKYNLGEHIFGFKKYPTYKGEVIDKIELLSGFKFSLCFENLTDVKGFITEKIFDCFKARCVPIYWGASDIEKHIPMNCFIDFRNFFDYEKLLIFLSSINENRYNRYIENIERLLADKKVISLWFEEGYSKFFLEDVLESKHG